MSPQVLATALLLPPLLLVLLALVASAAARRWNAARLMIAAAMTGLLLLATPFASGTLRASLERHAMADGAAGAEPPPLGAIVVLSAEAARHADGTLSPGPLSLERLAAAAMVARRTGLPVLVTGGPLSPDDPPIAEAMAEAMERLFGIAPRWVEREARDTAGNARHSAALLKRDGIAAAYVVTHAWHMPRSLEAFAREGLVALPAPVRIGRVPDGRAADWLPRPDHLAESWFMLREWLGILVYRLRDG
jgi:uncharacterized SAM-binding protein YcdF (DUF218 family)